jgi:hypothetical protein
MWCMAGDIKVIAAWSSKSIPLMAKPKRNWLNVQHPADQGPNKSPINHPQKPRPVWPVGGLLRRAIPVWATGRLDKVRTMFALCESVRVSDNETP